MKVFAVVLDVGDGGFNPRKGSSEHVKDDFVLVERVTVVREVRARGRR